MKIRSRLLKTSILGIRNRAHIAGHPHSESYREESPRSTPSRSSRAIAVRGPDFPPVVHNPHPSIGHVSAPSSRLLPSTALQLVAVGHKQLYSLIPFDRSSISTSIRSDWPRPCFFRLPDLPPDLRPIPSSRFVAASFVRPNQSSDIHPACF